MDPKIAFEDLTRSLGVSDWTEACDCLDALIQWIEMEGYVSDLTRVERPRKPFPVKLSRLIDQYNSLLSGAAQRENADDGTTRI